MWSEHRRGSPTPNAAVCQLRLQAGNNSCNGRLCHTRCEMSSSSSTVSHPSGDSGIGPLIHQPKVPFLIGVAGGTASGKSTVCRKIMDKLGKDAVERQQRVVCISQDSFYRELSPLEKQEALKGNYNFDHPDALDVELMQRILQDILRGREVQIPVYDFTLNMRYDFLLCLSFFLSPSPPLSWFKFFSSFFCLLIVLCRKTDEVKRIFPADVGKYSCSRIAFEVV